MHVRALVLSAALVLGACGGPDADPIGPFTRPSSGGGASRDTTNSSTTNCCGVLEVVTRVSGAAPASASYLDVWDWTGWWLWASLPASGTARTSLSAGSYWLSPNLSGNCTGAFDGPGEDWRVDIAANDTTRVSVTIDCEPAGTVGLRFNTTEGDSPSKILVKLHRQDAPREWQLVVPFGGLVQQIVQAGDWMVETEVADHCVTTEVEPAEFSVAEGAVVDVAIRLSCERLTGMLHVTTSTVGGDAGLVLHTGGECDPQFDWDTWTYYSSNCLELPPNGERTYYHGRGSWTLQVTHGVASCTVLPSDPVTVEIVGGETTELAVTATCD